MAPTNVLFILSDQHSRRVTGCYGNPVVKTPNLDALAAQGTRFASAYCQTPICVPARASLATGRYAYTIGSWDNATPYVGTEAASWGHRLIAEGHKVTTIGKLHYRKIGDPCGFPDQRIPLHVLDGIGDLYGLLREKMPVRPQSRNQVLEARAGEAEYIRYDRGTAQTAVRWLKQEAQDQVRPWVLMVSFATPHFPLVVPERYFNLYPLDSLPLPVQWRPEEWSRHPVLEFKRRQQALDTPFDERTVRNAMAAYYGLVTFLDEQIGIVLQALQETGFAHNTRIIYTTDHGENLGEHGMWWKSSMYESSVAVPLIVAGPDIPAGKVVGTNAMLVDIFPAIVEAAGAEFAPEDADLPGESLFRLAQEPDKPRTAFSEYHAIFSPSGVFMIRNPRYKYVHYVGYPPQLFDLVADPDETKDLADDPTHAGTLRALQAELRSIVNPEEVDRRAKADQRRRLNAAGGPEVVLREGVKIPYSPAPEEFGPAPVEARERAKQRSK
ncbi:MAG TPA: sulfatase-like hydrolase/transferase [Candidatus Acidoferrum sp.]|nr:sulfatase-like hydrolase/transferase [Candidatus Methylomirabilis sp.]HWU40322.1 sulfatase-like hydrolase/transferase [Candidatus Acidoferrum sp.]